MTRQKKGVIFLVVSAILFFSLTFIRAIASFIILQAGAGFNVLAIVNTLIGLVAWICIAGVIVGIYLIATKGKGSKTNLPPTPPSAPTTPTPPQV